MTESKSTATIYDVAERAGVSASTVSRVFSRPDRVSFATAEKIRAAAAELGYRTRMETRTASPADSRSESHTLGMVLADGSNPFFQELRRGADHAAATENMVVLATDIRESLPNSQLAVSRLVPLVDALLLASSRLANGDVQKIARHLPTVVLNRPVPGVPSVVIDSYTGTLRAAVHLFEQGSRSLTYLAGPENSWADGLRWRALLDSTDATAPASSDTAFVNPHRAPVLTPELAKKMSGVRLRQMRLDEPSIRGGRRAFTQWADNPTDSVLCFNDLVAIGFISQAKEAGVNIPGDVLVVGYDNTDFTSLMHPSVTSVAGPLRSVGRVGAANAIALAKGLKPQLSKPRVLPTRLVMRESTMRR